MRVLSKKKDIEFEWNWLKKSIGYDESTMHWKWRMCLMCKTIDVKITEVKVTKATIYGNSRFFVAEIYPKIRLKAKHR